MSKRTDHKVKVILMEQVGKYKPGSEAELKKGYVLHYLLPNGKAVFAKGNEQLAESLAKEIEEKHAKLNEAANQVLEKLKELFQNKPLTIQRASGMRGILYGSIAAPDISKELHEKYQLEINKKDIVFNPIKTIGDYIVTIKLYGSSLFKLPISVVGLS